MTDTATQHLTKDEILDLVERHLEPLQPADYRLEIDRSQVSHRSGTWQMVARPTDPNADWLDYSNILVKACLQLEEQEGIYVLLLSALPPDND